MSRGLKPNSFKGMYFFREGLWSLGTFDVGAGVKQSWLGFMLPVHTPVKLMEWLDGGMWAIQQLLSLPTTFINLTETEFCLHIAIQKEDSDLEDTYF